MPVPRLPLSASARSLIRRLADALIPLADWIVTKPYVPVPSRPWRTGGVLNASSLQVADFFEMLLRETSGDADLKARWDASAASPLGMCPIREVTTWRANRGLNSVPRFAITMSDAVLIDVETREISRGEFYADYWKALASAYAAADQAAQDGAHLVEEQQFAAQLLADTNPAWPHEAAPSSRLCKQFVKDVLYCYLGLRGAAPDPRRNAVLEELGERRRIGNTYTSRDADEAIKLLHEVLRALQTMGARHPLAEPGKDYPTQPIGSPLVNARDL